MTIRKFQAFILSWYKTHKRDYLPWRPQGKVNVFDPYKVLVSEIMLQQTQVARVLQKFPEFLGAFPTIEVLVSAPLNKLLQVWQGMGYNRRALYLQRAAKEIVARFNGNIPQNVDDLLSLPGIGSYTAGAVACFAFNKPVVFLDTNIRKVFLSVFFNGRGKTQTEVGDREILVIAKKALYVKSPREWHYALMDYGALELADRRELLLKAKSYHRQSPFLGSTRYFRSRIVRQVLQTPFIAKPELVALVKQDKLFLPSAINLEKVLQSLLHEGLISKDEKQRLFVS